MLTSLLNLVVLYAIGGKSSPATNSTLDPYEPYSVQCPTAPIVRRATAINPDEALYTTKRRLLADQDLAEWLARSLGPTALLSSYELPKMALALGGGGPKAGLLAAGIVQALDTRDSSTSVSGLLQSMTYMSALSGGSLTFSGVIGNNFEKISTLRSTLLDASYQNETTLFYENEAQIISQIEAKAIAGFPVTLVDIYGRLLGYDFIGGADGAAGTTMSSVLSSSAFMDAELPYPIIQSTNAAVSEGQCYPTANSSVWEYGPYEFGSWYRGVDAFVFTKYLGSSLVAGHPSNQSRCTVNFDNLGFIIGTSANLIASSNCTNSNSSSTISSSLAPLADELASLQNLSTTDLNYGIIPNPFYGYEPSRHVRKDKDLFMLDGGVSGQGFPIWSWLQPERSVDVILAFDLASDGSNNITSGSSLAVIQTQAQQQGLTRMPSVPTVDQIAAENLTSHARFFGCNQVDKILLIWVPDTNTTEYGDDEVSFSAAGIDDVIALGTDMATQTDNDDWPTCLACAIVKDRLDDLPVSCNACFAKYCWEK